MSEGDSAEAAPEATPHTMKIVEGEIYFPTCFVKTKEGWVSPPESEWVPTGRAEVEIHDEQIDLTEEQRKKMHDFVKGLCKAKGA